MIYRFLADVLVVVHLAFVIFAVFGGVFCFRWRKAAWVHIPAVLWAAVIEFTGWICPLTPLEVSLRIQGGTSGYSESFVEHYIVPVLYPPGLTFGIQIALGIAILLFNLSVYSFVYKAKMTETRK